MAQITTALHKAKVKAAKRKNRRKTLGFCFGCAVLTGLILGMGGETFKRYLPELLNLFFQ